MEKSRSFSASKVLELPLPAMLPSTTNPRLVLEKEPFNELKKSIVENGLLQPIVVRPHGDGYQIIGGHRRFAAMSQLAKELPGDGRFTHISAVVKDVDDATVAVLQLAENLNRADLSPLEVSNAAVKAVDGGMKKEHLAEALGWHPRKLYRYLQLAAAPQWLKDFAKAVAAPAPANKDDVVRGPRAAGTEPASELPGLSVTDMMELVVLYNALKDADVAALTKNPAHKPRAEATTIKLAQTAAAEQWPTAKLRDEIRRLRETPATGAAKKAAASRAAKPAFTITKDSAVIDFKRIDALTEDERAALADELMDALGAVGFAAVINPAAR